MERPRILVACEYSGVVRDAFKDKGWDAWSCDLRPTEIDGQHYECDVKEILKLKWDLIIAHPPCTYFSNAGARWYYHPKYKDGRIKQRNEALEFVMLFANHNCPHIAIENPIGTLSSLWKKPDQIIQPYEYGHTASKATCLWLKELPKLMPTDIKEVEYYTTSNGRKFTKWFYESSVLPLKERERFRSRTFEGVAKAMAEQWGSIIKGK